MKIKMLPNLDQVKNEASGIATVIRKYYQHGSRFGIEFVEGDDYDLKVVHAGMSGGDCDVALLHGLYWTADYDASAWEWRANQRIAEAVRSAKAITVPSAWVAELFKRDMRLTPHVVPHGIDVDEWNPGPNLGYVLWNKNRPSDVCDPTPVHEMAKRFTQQRFVTTFTLQGKPNQTNVEVTGTMPHAEMKKIIQSAGVYLATTKETFCVGALEAMASAVPVLGFAHGGILDFVEHGKSGYLAQPGDYDDLAEGLHWCLRNRKAAGEYARGAARAWTWDAALEKLVVVFREAMVVEPPTAAIIIPSYNYAEKVGRAIESAVKQDYEQLTDIVIVDDGSDDGERLREVVEGFRDRDNRVRLLRQHNQGVSAARNAGIASVSAKYIACLDADDALEPEFVSTCVKSLEEDRSLGIAYTSLRYIKPDGETGISKWPGEFDYDRQIIRQNQIPTACVFRRVMWQRLGGYKSRYAPKGCGSEDAEFWTRAGAYGFNARKVTNEPLFIYSWLSGGASGNPDYVEKDWLGLHPWATKDGDKKHPFASVATPKFFSHPAHQYDEPLISVVIPVGPNHYKLVEDALDSLESQKLRKWEAIVVWDCDTDEAWQEWFDKAYPYVRQYHTPQLESGAGAARNIGAAQARAPFLVFLDADDMLYPPALEQMLDAWRMESAIIYTDYVGKAYIDNVEELAPDLQQRIYRREDDGETMIGYKAYEYDPVRAQQQPQGERPYIWCNVTALIPKAWHDEIGGFDEGMRTWEDVDYHWRMAKAGKCYQRLAEELLVYRFYTGQRRDLGVHQHKDTLEYLKAKHREIKTVGCNCGGKKSMSVPQMPWKNPAAAAQSQPQASEVSSMNDGDLIMVKYVHPNRGMHSVIGAETRTKYGQRKLGDTFLINRRDQAAQPHLFIPVEEIQSQAPQAPQVRRDPPPDLAVLRDIEAGTPIEEPEIEELQEPEMQAEPEAPQVPEGFDLTALPGIGAAMAEKFQADGIEGPADIAKLTVEDLTKYKGISEMKAEILLAAVKSIVATA